LRLGAEIVGSVEDVLTYSFGEYKMLVDGTVNVDETTNGLARPGVPANVGGRLTVSSFNLLNYFTTLNDGHAEMTPGQAATASQRQTHPYVGMSVTADGHRHNLLPNGRYDEARGPTTGAMR
jgi:predicted extracellular nuclease